MSTLFDNHACAVLLQCNVIQISLWPDLKKWYFVTKIVLTYCEKNVLVIEKKISNWKLKDEKLQKFGDH